MRLPNPLAWLVRRLEANRDRRLLEQWRAEQDALRHALDAATTVVVDVLPPCWFCPADAAYDAQVITVPGRPWAYLCHPHMVTHGPGQLGVGLGQRLVLRAGAR